jgi:hypothetical protein
MKENEDWIKDSIKHLTKAYRNRLKVHRISYMVVFYYNVRSYLIGWMV